MTNKLARLAIVAFVLLSIAFSIPIFIRSISGNKEGKSDSSSKKNLSTVEVKSTTSDNVKKLDEIVSDNTGTSSNQSSLQEQDIQEVSTGNGEMSNLVMLTLPNGDVVTLPKVIADEYLVAYLMEKENIEKEYPQRENIDLQSDVIYETTVNSSFKVEDIKYSIVKHSEDGQGTLIAQVKGVIAGLDGKYEIELPYEKASKLSIGDSFAITYQTTRVNDKVVIVNISY